MEESCVFKGVFPSETHKNIKWDIFLIGFIGYIRHIVMTRDVSVKPYAPAQLPKKNISLSGSPRVLLKVRGKHFLCCTTLSAATILQTAWNLSTWVIYLHDGSGSVECRTPTSVVIKLCIPGHHPAQVADLNSDPCGKHCSWIFLHFWSLNGYG